MSMDGIGTHMDILPTAGMFAGDHGPEGAWHSLKGGTLTPPLQMPLESEAMGDSRHQTNDMPSQRWDAHVVVHTPLTGGGGSDHQTPLVDKSGKGKM